jgi:hypothetical protein
MIRCDNTICMHEHQEKLEGTIYLHLTSLPFNTTIPHSKLKDKLRELVQKNGQRRCKYLVLGRDRS